ncbi:RNA polymerase sigma factor (sigma-70 family) [Stackebrandtia albiflava]|uniref:RNA polymerase sigma factor (Sigma-70 family) n=1 Tax=Stackebrandtia albiflava TaxID=406432 RepID=A0A562VES6_9ACTN|nr:sigma-70 family RNA polymerase sigma factor [Stackebrandtia albiflava]TWJ16380.1 RNA polymerase sigma factor (sigma-70 family) [Stackebrandtia albiflava]
MNDTTPFAHAVHRHGTTVLRVCRAVLGPGQDAEDAWSETFLAALRAWPDLAPDTHIEAWLVRVARRKAVDVIRTRARQAVPTDRIPETPSDTDDPQHHDRDVWAAVAALPERQRLALAYHYLGGLPHTETAGIIGGTPDAVRRAAADGLRTLRRTLPHDDTPKGPSR